MKPGLRGMKAAAIPAETWVGMEAAWAAEFGEENASNSDFPFDPEHPFSQLAWIYRSDSVMESPDFEALRAQMHRAVVEMVRDKLLVMVNEEDMFPPMALLAIRSSYSESGLTQEQITKVLQETGLPVHEWSKGEE